jgi:hypothetical protein
VLVDWDTTRLAPPERDLWHVLARLDPETADTATAWQALVGTLEELAARHTSPKDQPFLGQEVTTRSSPAGP